MPKIILKVSKGNYPEKTKRIKKRVIKGFTDKEGQMQDGENMGGLIEAFEGRSGGNWYEMNEDDRIYIRNEAAKYMASGHVDIPELDSDYDEDREDWNWMPFEAEEIDKMMGGVSIQYAKEEEDEVIDLRSLKGGPYAAAAAAAAAVVDDGRPVVPSDESDESVYGPSDYEYEDDDDDDDEADVQGAIASC